MPYDIIIGRNESDRKRFGDKGTIFLGRHFVKMGQTTSLSNKVLLDVARAHVILVAGKRGCLSGNTLVFTNRGYKEIKKFDEQKNKILSFNKESKKFEWESAELLKYSIKNESLLKIKFKDNKEIILTKEHPLLAVTGNKLLSLLWRKANKLKIGDEILSIGKSFEDLIPSKIKEISEIKKIKKVYDLRVPKNHSFIANGIISHNSGKSYTLGVIAEGMANLPKAIADNLAVVIFDTMGIFWSMKYANERQENLLEKWNLQPKELDIDVYVPKGSYDEYVKKDLPVDYSFSIKTSELTSDDWCNVFEVKITEPIGILIDRVIETLIDRKKDYDIKEIVTEIKKQKTFSKTVRLATENRFLSAAKWGLFSKKGSEIRDIVKPGRISVLDISAYRRAVGSWSIKGLVIAMISRKLLAQRMIARKAEELQAIKEGTKFFGQEEIEEMPLVWLMIDEGHEFLPRVGTNPATRALIQLLREGRQPGISMVVATQQPGEIARDVITQSDIVLSHRVTARMDLDALNAIMQTYLLADINSYMNNLPKLKGGAIILDDNSERIYPMRVRPKMSWHGGEAPTAVKIRKRAELELL